MTLHAIQAAGLISTNIDLVKAAVLGFVEGLTEYLPVSSTGHLLLMERILGWGDDAFGKSFAILIQLGAILALLSIYFGRLWNLARNMFTDWAAARFVIGVLLAFLPAAVIGALAYPIIKTYLFDVRIVCVALIIGGFVLLWVDRLDLKPRYHESTEFTLPMYFGIGVCQCLSMIPGVSRAGATIVSAMISTRPIAVQVRSPMPNGRNITSMMPAARLLSVPCSARPMARPIAPSTAMKLVVSMPKVVSTALKVKTRTA